jgi:hypothetical protein
MIDATYWWEEATKFIQSARETEDPQEQQELIELAEVCQDVAVKMEERATGG